MKKLLLLLPFSAALAACADSTAPVSPSSSIATPAAPSFTTSALLVDGLVINRQPSTAIAGSPIAPSIIFQTTDGGVHVNAPGVTVTLTKASGPGTISGTLSLVTDTTGRAIFANVVVSTAGTYTLKATTNAGYSVTTAPFSVTGTTSSGGTGGTPYANAGNYTAPSSYREPTLGYTVPYTLFVPAKATPTTPMPLIIYGHSAGGYVTTAGTIDSALKIEGLMQTVTANKATFPAMVLFPQMPSKNADGRESWRRSLGGIVSKLIAGGYNIDRTRIYFVGYSTGGIEALKIAYQYPTYYAAIVPIDPAFTSMDMTGTSFGATVGGGTGAPYYGAMAAKWYDPAAYDDGSHGGPDAMGEWARVVAAGKTSLLILHGTSPSEVTLFGTANRDIGDMTKVIAKFAQFGAAFATTMGSNTQVQVPSTATKYLYSLFNGTTTGLAHWQMNTIPTSYTGDRPLFTWLLAQHR